MSESEQLEERIAAPHPFVPPLLALLRAGTRDAHSRIEAIPGLGILLDPAVSAGAYVGALKALYAFQAGMHRRLPPLLRGVTGVNWPDPSVLQALVDDLDWFGADLPKPASVPRAVRDSSTALGALYLLEGSQLGARVIGRSVARSLAVSPGRGGTFFCGHSADNARERWQEFCTLLASEGSRLDSAGCARVVVGAQSSFAFLESMLCGARAAGPGKGVDQGSNAARAIGEATRAVN